MSVNDELQLIRGPSEEHFHASLHYMLVSLRLFGSRSENLPNDKPLADELTDDRVSCVNLDLDVKGFSLVFQKIK